MEQLPTSHDVSIYLDELEPPFVFRTPFGDDPFALLLFDNNSAATLDQRLELCDQIAASPCRYAVCAGADCEIWHDCLDECHLATDPDFDPPEERHLMTSWHTDEPLADVVHFFLRNTDFNDQIFTNYLVILLGPNPECARHIREALARHL